jgi:hypothetical protein
MQIRAEALSYAGCTVEQGSFYEPFPQVFTSKHNPFPALKHGAPCEKFMKFSCFWHHKGVIMIKTLTKLMMASCLALAIGIFSHAHAQYMGPGTNSPEQPYPIF